MRREQRLTIVVNYDDDETLSPADWDWAAVLVGMPGDPIARLVKAEQSEPAVRQR